MINLGKLQEVNLRDVWQYEQYDFSDWLAKDENLSLFGDTLALTLIESEKEKMLAHTDAIYYAKMKFLAKLYLLKIN